MRSGLVQRTHDAPGHAVTARRQRVEQAHLHLRQRGQRGVQLVVAGGVEVVDQQAHAHAARGGVAQRAQHARAGTVVGQHVGLQVERALGALDQRQPRVQRVVAVDQQPHARRVGARQRRRHHGMQRAALAVERLRRRGRGRRRQRGAAAEPQQHQQPGQRDQALQRVGEQLGRRVAAQASRRRTGSRRQTVGRRHAVVSGVWSLVFVTHGRQLRRRRLSPDVVARGGVCQLQSSAGPMAPRWTPARRAAGVDRARTGRSASGQRARGTGRPSRSVGAIRGGSGLSTARG